MADKIRLEDGTRAGVGDRVFNYYDRKVCTIVEGPDREGWVDVQHEDGTRKGLNGERMCSLQTAERKGWIAARDADSGVIGAREVAVTYDRELNVMELDTPTGLQRLSWEDALAYLHDVTGHEAGVLHDILADVRAFEVTGVREARFTMGGAS